MRTTEQARALYLAELPLIERIAAAVARRNGVTGADSEDFLSIARLKLIENEYAILKKFHGRSHISTWLTVVIQRFFLDHKQREIGRWRPSTEARRMGEVAVRLEELMIRDGHTFDEACGILMLNEKHAVSVGELHWVRVRLPQRAGRPVLLGMPRDSDATTDGMEIERAAMRRERAEVAGFTSIAIAKGLLTLSPRDRQILELRYRDGVNAVEAARRLGITRQQLQRAITRALAALRLALEAGGISRQMALDILEHESEELLPQFASSKS